MSDRRYYAQPFRDAKGIFLFAFIFFTCSLLFKLLLMAEPDLFFSSIPSSCSSSETEEYVTGEIRLAAVFPYCLMLLSYVMSLVGFCRLSERVSSSALGIIGSCLGLVGMGFEILVTFSRTPRDFSWLVIGDVHWLLALSFLMIALFFAVAMSESRLRPIFLPFGLFGGIVLAVFFTGAPWIFEALTSVMREVGVAVSVRIPLTCFLYWGFGIALGAMMLFSILFMYESPFRGRVRKSEYWAAQIKVFVCGIIALLVFLAVVNSKERIEISHRCNCGYESDRYSRWNSRSSHYSWCDTNKPSSVKVQGIAQRVIVDLVGTLWMLLILSLLPVKARRAHDANVSGWLAAGIVAGEAVGMLTCFGILSTGLTVIAAQFGILSVVLDVSLLGGLRSHAGRTRYEEDDGETADSTAVEPVSARPKVVLKKVEKAEPAQPVVMKARESVRRAVTTEETEVRQGESFRCPYCRTVHAIDSVLSVSVSASMLGDEVLGPDEQRRFLPTKFTGNGLALDDDGGVCTDIACPHCHMTLPSRLLETPQTVMSVIGAAGAGKSVYLASAIWQCRQVLTRQFGITFLDLDPTANRWINAYEERLFFQEDDTSLQQIEKTDIQAANVTRSVKINGDQVLLALPSFFRVRPGGRTQEHSLVVYDSAGEHFRAGADSQSSAVTLNMLNADVLFFMYDPSADPRFRDRLTLGSGTARNYAQRQDILLNEMADRIRKHMGNRGQERLTRPLIFGVSKADLLSEDLPLEADIYVELGPRRWAIDVEILKALSEKTEELLNEYVPEVVLTVREIADEVWFLPVSALGHNPMKEGVRPCDIQPIWTELPILITLARKGLVETVNGTL